MSQNVGNDVGPGDPKEALWTSSITWELVRNADAGPTHPDLSDPNLHFYKRPSDLLACLSLKNSAMVPSLVPHAELSCFSRTQVFTILLTVAH